MTSSNPDPSFVNLLGDTIDFDSLNTDYIRYPVIQILLTEVKRGVDKYGDFENLMQFGGALKGEFFEVLDELASDPVDLTKVYREILQVAAVAIRAIEEIERRTLG